MAEPLFSPFWYRVAGLVPRVRGHGEIHRHAYRGQVWYVLEDHAAGRSHRFSPIAHRLIGLMDGRRTVQQIWEAANELLGDDAPTQDETIRLLAQLHAADVLQSDVTPDALEVFRRYEKQQRRRWIQRIAYPLAVHFPLFDPEAVLVRGLPLVRPLFGRVGFAIWLAVVATGVLLAASHWGELTQDITDRALAPQNLLWIWLTYPIIKAIHEFAHAFAVKVWGGEVHEMGVMFLVLVPLPYVDASAASAFRSKWKRVVVGGAGIALELFLAAVAMIVWVNVEPGAVRALAYNVILIGAVSTLFFNGNPLLRFDGYYVLADAIEIPNLGTRSRTYLAYLVERYLFGDREASSPASAPGEAAWFALYGVAAFLYRFFIIVAIVLLVADRFFVIGALIAIWAAITQLGLPVAKALTGVFRKPRRTRQRRRAEGVVAGTIAAAALGVFLLPLPLWTRAEGVVWLPEESQVRAAADGFVLRLLAEDGSRVRRGDPLVETDDPLLRTQVRLLDARVRELEARLAALRLVDRAQVDVTRKELESARAAARVVHERLGSLEISSPTHGRFVVPKAADLPGSFLRRGQVIGWVAEDAETVIRVAVGQDDIALVRERTRGVEAALADWTATPVAATVIREVPAASDELPNRALGASGGGPFAVDPRDPAGVRTLEKVFQLDLALPPEHAGRLVGRRVHVRFDHGHESLARQLYRTVRQLFLSRFAV